jgi:hypothetical protein
MAAFVCASTITSTIVAVLAATFYDDLPRLFQERIFSLQSLLACIAVVALGFVFRLGNPFEFGVTGIVFLLTTVLVNVIYALYAVIVLHAFI